MIQTDQIRQKDRLTDAQGIVGQTNKWIAGQIDRRAKAPIDRRTDGQKEWTDMKKDRCTYRQME
jgi:hypothetical protein